MRRNVTTPAKNSYELTWTHGKESSCCPLLPSRRIQDDGTKQKQSGAGRPAAARDAGQQIKSICERERKTESLYESNRSASVSNS